MLPISKIRLRLTDLLSFKQLLDIFDATVGVSRSHEILDDFTVRVDQELLEVPGHVSAFELRFISQPVVQRMLSFTKDLNLLHHWEFDVILLDKINDFVSFPRLLGSELIAWECKDFESLILQIFVDLD